MAKKDPRYFAPVYEQYHEQIFYFVLQRLSSVQEADDITSQVFLKALVKLEQFEWRGAPFSAWLYRIAINEMNQYFRENKKRRTIQIERVQLREMGEEMALRGVEDEQLRLMVGAINQLEEEELQLIEMRYFEKRAFKEIGEILEITENNAKVRTYRILDRMREYVNQQPGEHE